MNLESVQEDARPATQEACVTCGESDFYAEAGHYYCALCNTQSQSARIYVDENFIPERQHQARAAVLRGDKSAASKKTKGKGYTPSTWEVFNVLLRKMADRLVEIGFPEIIKNKIFHLYVAFMMRRKVIFLSRSNPASKSAITIGEPKQNTYAFYGPEGIPAHKHVRKKDVLANRMKRKAHPGSDEDNQVNDEEGQGQSGQLIQEELVSRAQRKKKIATSKRKAMERDYLTTESAEVAQDDAAFEKAINSQQSSSTALNTTTTGEESKEKGKPIYLRYTKAARTIKGSFLKGLNVRRTMSTIHSRMRREQKYLREYNIAVKLLRFEKFYFRTCFILVFVALRQLGFPVVITDMMRLYNCGILYFRNKDIYDLMKEYDAYKDVERGTTNPSFIIQPFYDVLSVSEDIHNFISYMGIKRFCYPRLKEIVPKYIDDFVLPREFECLLNLVNHAYTYNDLTTYNKRGLHERIRYVPELLVMTEIIVLLKMLFGLDDITERYQSEFAKLVNKVIREEVKEQRCKMEDWTELFVIEEWFGYLQRRRELIKRELYCSTMITPNQPPTVPKLNEFLKKKSYIDDEYADDDESVARDQKAAKECFEFFKNLRISDQAPSTEGQFNNNRQSKPYVPLPLPTQSIVEQFLEKYPLVGDPSFKPDLFKVDFEKKRLDFIWNPRKYTKLLEACGHRVQIVHGDAVNNFPEKVKKGTILVFQPYKSFDDFVHPLRKINSGSMKLLFKVCEDIVPSVSAERIRIKNTEEALFPNLVNSLGKVLTAKVLYGRAPVMTRWNKEASSDSE